MIARINKLSFLLYCQTNEHDDWSQPTIEPLAKSIVAAVSASAESRDKTNYCHFMVFTFQELCFTTCVMDT